MKIIGNLNVLFHMLMCLPKSLYFHINKCTVTIYAGYFSDQAI